MRLRDHDDICEHGHKSGHYPDPAYPGFSCPGGAEVEIEAVPWCETHDSIIKDGVCDWVWGNKYNVEPVNCKLADPPQVFRIGGNE